MDDELTAPSDDEATEPAQDATTQAPRSSFLSDTRASRIRTNLSQRRKSASGLDKSTAASAASAAQGQSTPGGAPPANSGASAQARRLFTPHTYTHILAGFCYLGMPVVPVAVLFGSTQRFARFHALQALSFFVPLAVLAYGLSLLTPTSIILGILYGLIALAIVALALLWMTVAIAAFEGYALTVPLLERLIPKPADLREDVTARSSGKRALLELGIGAGVSLLLLILTLIIPLNHWFGALSVNNLSPLGLSKGLPLWMIVSALLRGLIFAAIGLVLLAVCMLGLRRGKFFPSWAAIVSAALTAAGTGLLIADAIQSALSDTLTRQFDTMVNSSPLPRTAAVGAKTLLPQVTNGLNSLNTINNAQSHLLLPGTLLLVLGMLGLVYLLSQLYYKS
jgi:uncharacterized membrane protein